MASQTFHSPGKLLLTGEYVVLDGALALAIPTTYGQSLEITHGTEGTLTWQSIDDQGTVWYEEAFRLPDLSYEGDKSTFSDTLQSILQVAQELNPEFLSSEKGYTVTTVLDFPRNWGLGTSSTLIHNISKWAKVDAYSLLQQSFGGSGYDVAVAAHGKSLLYALKNGRPEAIPVSLPWDFTEQLYFVHLNQKQDSKEGIARYRKAKKNEGVDLDLFSRITEELSQCTSRSRFAELLTLHEAEISALIQLPTVKEQLFPDFSGIIKSLGAWGGDFVMVLAKTEDDLSYFRNKGYETIIPFHDMIP
ncbi:GYDIA family GHMP kinase [Aureisphaera galaxeae]|uniref:GYDIA family GHMP kinase n=1 Tax=Aureisphaera galaxeae TaxID=1538023 RepID=UPI0023507261|nr:GYDIA family GHMP kinase [Aureisphaera galaxeae]MDC8003022.1 GYDIA family GHMP kinase [Aureisphaera galaxeae]